MGAPTGEAFINEQQRAWIAAHVHMYEFFGGVTPILVPDNAPTATNRKQSDKYEPVLIQSYEELARHYNTAIIPARVRTPKSAAEQASKSSPFSCFGILTTRW